MESNGKILSDIPINGALFQNGSNKSVRKGAGSTTPEQTGKVFVGSGGKKEAEVVGLGLNDKLTKSQIDELDKAKKYALDQSVRFVMEKQRQAHQQQQQKVALYSQALALMGRIYVGSINFDVFEDQIRSVFGIYGPIKHVNMSIDPSTGNHKGFCFIEYEIPEAAHLARDSMNGKFLGGRTIKVMPVGRSDSTPQAQPIIDMVMNEARQYNRIYVACVHPDITENDLRSVFMAFGEMTKCQLARHPSGKKHRGFGYIEFKDSDSVKDSIEGMNGFDLGGQCLQVGRAVTPPDAINYMSTGTASSALPAAAAIAAAELTAKIHAQEILGTNKTSPDASPSQGGASPTGERGSSSPTPQQSTQSAPGRRRGFGGFASVPPPAIVQPTTQLLALPSQERGAQSQSAASSPSSSNETQTPSSIPIPISAPQLVIPQLGTGSTIQIPAKQTLAELQTQQEDSSINDFYSTLKDEKFEPPKLINPTISTTLPQPPKQAVQTQKPKISSPIALPSTIPSEPKPKKQKKEKVSGLDLLDRIGEKAKSKSDGFDASKKATFAPLARHLRPKDPNTVNDDEDESGPQLAIEGPESWTALALRDDGGVVAKKAESNDNKKIKKKGDKNERGKRKGKGKKKPRFSSGPKLNSATKLAAANLAGALSDNLQTQKDEKGDEASLASQEHVQIRGNDARHLLIQKLMRTNRSSVIVLRNMVTPEGVDEFLENEIREECQKYGQVVDVVIVQEEDIANVKIFVRFAEPFQAETARNAIDGRYFDGRTVSAQAYDQVMFDHDDFTG